MIYLFTAMYQEAAGLIEKSCLKKDASCPKFQHFTSGGDDPALCLSVTGTGAAAAACAVTHVLTLHPPGEGDLIVSFGCAGLVSGRAQESTYIDSKIYLCRKITEKSTGRIFLPDMVCRHSFADADLVTMPRPFCRGQQDAESEEQAGLAGYPCKNHPGKTKRVPVLADMEAASIFQAANYFVGPHQMIFLKILSDAGIPDEVDSRSLRESCSMASDEILTFLRGLPACKNTVRDKIAEEEERTERLCRDLCCTRAMRQILSDHLRYFKNAGIDIEAYLAQRYRDGSLPCRNKKEGMALLRRMHEELVKS